MPTRLANCDIFRLLAFLRAGVDYMIKTAFKEAGPCGLCVYMCAVGIMHMFAVCIYVCCVYVCVLCVYVCRSITQPCSRVGLNDEAAGRSRSPTAVGRICMYVCTRITDSRMCMYALQDKNGLKEEDPAGCVDITSASHVESFKEGNQVKRYA